LLILSKILDALESDSYDMANQTHARSITQQLLRQSCYDMEVGANRVRVFYGTEQREKEKDSRYIQKATAPAAGPCIRPATSRTSVTTPSSCI
jgi:hypothetical protein